MPLQTSNHSANAVVVRILRTCAASVCGSARTGLIVSHARTANGTDWQSPMAGEKEQRLLLGERKLLLIMG